MVEYRDTDKRDKAEDESGHPIKTGIGGLGGAIAGGAAAGMAGAGPLGGVVGAVIGGLAGGLAGKGLAEATEHTEEDEAYWRKHYQNRPYVDKETDYEHYQPAYQYGAEAHQKHQERSFDKVKDKLKEGWDQARGGSKLSWEQAEDATRDAYNRKIQLREEHLRANKTVVEAGEVDIRKEVVTEKKMIDVPVEREEVVITHTPVSSSQDTTGEIGEEEIRIPLREERVTITKEPVIREEVSVSKRKIQDTQHMEDTVRREELRVDDKGRHVKREEPV